MNQKLKIVEGARVCMNASDDTYIVEGAWGTVVETGITLSIVRWDSMLAFRADYRYRNELKDVLITTVSNYSLGLFKKYKTWTPEPIAQIHIDDCIKYIGEDTKRPQYMVICFVYIQWSYHNIYYM